MSTNDKARRLHFEIFRYNPEDPRTEPHTDCFEIDETPFRTSTILPPSATSFEVPEEILALNEEVKFEVLVREASYNQTAVESCFEIE